MFQPEKIQFKKNGQDFIIALTYFSEYDEETNDWTYYVLAKTQDNHMLEEKIIINIDRTLLRIRKYFLSF